MRHALVAVCLLLLAATLSAATFDVPTDAELLDRADLIVVATVLDSASREAADRMILTDHRLRVEQVLKGRASATITVTEAGGFVNGRGIAIPGSAAYEQGSRVVVFLRRRADGSYYTANMGLGHYRFAKDKLVRDAVGIEATSGEPFEIRNAETFIDAIRSGKPSASQPRIASDARPEPIIRTNAAPSAYVLTGGGPKRWKGCEDDCVIGFTVNQVHPVVNTVQGLDAAYAAWTNHPNSFVNLESNNLGNDTGWTNDDQNDVVFNWNGSNPHSTCEGAKGCGIVYYNGPPFTHVFRGETFNDVVSADVLVHQSITNQTSFETILTHELGHALAFRHSNEGSPSSGGIMNSSVPTNLGANLDAWSEEALSVVYGPGLPCVPVTIHSTSGGGSVPHGDTSTLGVSASGDTPRTYQWFEGPSGNTTTPVGTNSPTFTTPAITETRQYWVRVSNACPSSVNSTTFTIEPVICNVPVISHHPVSQRVNPGSTATMSVAADGSTPFTYRWYRANTVGDTSTQVGTNSPTFTTPPLTVETKYWVRVLNACGQDDSALATITVGTQCVPPSITQQSPAITLEQGQGATISVAAAGDAPLTYQWYEGNAPDATKPIAGATTAQLAVGPFANSGTFRYWAKVTNACGNAASQTIVITVACPQIVVPVISAPPISHFSAGYNVSWTGNVTVTPTFELQEATNAAFTANLKTFTVTGALSGTIAPHLEIATDTRFYYRVRAISGCTQQPTAWSNTTSTVITAPLPSTSGQFAVSIPAGTTQSFTQDLLVPGFGETAQPNDTFAITTDVPWLTVFPASGALSAGGTTVQLTIHPSGLDIGTTTGTVQITRTNATSGPGITTHDGPVTTTFPFSVSLVTPVSPDPRDGNPPPGTLIIPAVAHAQGIGSPFRSDVRIVNVSFTDIDYEISYTASQTDGTQSGKKTTLTIRAGDVLALDDIVAAWFGAGMLGEGGVGTIEIRPLTSNNPLDTFASSRTYALDAGGTLGQFIPALRQNQFVGNFAQDSLGRISLQQVANSANYRTNLGFVEGSGVPVQLLARLVDGNNNVIQQVTRDLPAYGHLQRSLTDLFGNVNLADGRVEVEVLSPGGKATAYASVLNNQTNDPLMIFPVQPARTTAGRYVLAGIAEFVAADRNFHSDMRLYNGGTSPADVTLNYYDRGQTSPHAAAPARHVTLQPGQVYAVDNVLPTLWPGLIGGGSVVATAADNSSLVVTAQTYSRQPDGGTKGQFIPGVTFREAVGFGERALEVLQLEQSAQYRSNVGFVEVSGKPATIEVTAFEPDTKQSVVTSIPLQANEYRQFDGILASMGLGTVYNGRVSVKVITGEGRVYAYGSTIDNRTSDPTYVPAQ
jgi:hypothetical protein